MSNIKTKDFHYIIKHASGSFSDITCRKSQGETNASIKTLEQVEQEIDFFCNKDSENYAVAQYWSEQRKYMQVYKITKTEELITLPFSMQLRTSKSQINKEASIIRTPYQRPKKQFEGKVMSAATNKTKACVSILKYKAMLTPKLVEQAATLGLNKPQLIAILRSNDCIMEQTLNEELMEELMESYIQTNNL
ncbi:hypothetical protein Phi3ST:2_gp77 [Cellulophaga phage phi3ST:2]|nr:hypothetical protein Phi3ST:2_gp77 [Cellulophaga phage phi3ST:2]